jgi:hypothetical protein
MSLQRMDNVGVVVEDLPATIAFFRELGLQLEGQAVVEGEWAGRVTGLGDQRVEIAMMRTPDGHSRLELSRFLTPPVVASTRRSLGSAGTARSSSAKWSSTKTCIGSATSGGLKDCSSGWPSRSTNASVSHGRIRPEFPDLLDTATGDGGLRSPCQCLVA